MLDLGTTTLVGRLLAGDGAVLAEARLANPQRAQGPDILTRLQRAREGGSGELQALLVDGIRRLVAELLDRAALPPDRVAAVAAAGNPGLCHLLCRLPVETLMFPPHRSPLTGLTNIPVTDLNLGLAVPLQLFPAITGFVGGDLVAVLYGADGAVERACGPVESLNRFKARPEGIDSTVQQFNDSTHESGDSPPAGTAPALVLDLGTNAEIALWTGARWLVTSAAAGPAFEAANIACGMPLAPGAVTDVQLRNDRLELTVAGGGRPQGLCGSGLLALVAAARAGGLIDAGGRIVPPDEVATNLARYLAADGEGWAIAFHREARGELRLTQEDVRQLQLAKGAVRAGIDVLLERSALTAGDIGSVLITGAFGSALPVAAVKGIAMLPESVVEKSLFVPNGVLDGLAAFLADADGEARLQALLADIKPFPLSGTPAFEKRFLAALEF